METLAKLFSSGTLVKVMRLFLFHPDEPQDKEDIGRKTKSDRKSVAYETQLLKSIGFLKPKTFSKTVVRKQGRKRVGRKKKVNGFILNHNFPYLAPLKALLVNTDLMNKGELERRLATVGRIKLIVTAGVFMQEPDCQVDLLVVGDRIQRAKLASAVKAIEEVIGTEIRYAVLPAEEFEYRMSVRDRLLREIFEAPHLVVRNGINTTKNIDMRVV